MVSVSDVDVQVAEIIIYGGDWDMLGVHLRQHCGFVDRFVLVESDAAFSGDPRTPELERRRAELPAGDAEVRIITLGQLNNPDLKWKWSRARAQRDAGFMGVIDLDPDAIVFISDVDELIDASALGRLVAELDGPMRVAMDVRYQYLDRSAPGWPCCGSKVPVSLRRQVVGAPPFAQPCAVMCRRRHLGLPGESSVSAVRKAPGARTRWVAGWHLTGVGPSVQDGRRERTNKHGHPARTVEPDHMQRCAAAGVHFRGWWYAQTAERADFPPELEVVANLIPDALAPGPLPNHRYRRALRAWCQIRQWTWLPDALVGWVDKRMDYPGAVLQAALRLTDGVLVHLPARTWPNRPAPPLRQHASCSAKGGHCANSSGASGASGVSEDDHDHG